MGFGSIGSRHARILKQLGHSVSVVSKRPVQDYTSYPDIKTALDNSAPGYVVIANRTSEHFAVVSQLKALGFSGSVLVEKPLFDRMQVVEDLPFKVFVAYNMRFHPIINAIFQKTSACPLYSIQVYCGQYLPDWRPDRDYTQSYSACQKMGGGVLRDLSHELDYLTWIAGPWRAVAAKGGRFSDLQIDSDDQFSMIFETARCPIITLQINYLDLVSRREIIINGKDLAIKADLVGSRMWEKDKELQFTVNRDDTYTAQHQAILANDGVGVCTYRQGVDVLKLIESVEKASEKRLWVTN